MASQTAITPTREADFPEWYQQVVSAADLAENSGVRGCMIIKPFGFGIWERIQAELDARIKDNDVQNAYFPLLIPVSYLAKEAEHIDGFAKECAVVTHHRLEADPENGGLRPASPLTEPFVIRPTSETIIGEACSSWIQSYRDLPMKLNQWCNVMRWEMRTRLFLRTSEFLWQEGHNVFATEEEARADALQMHKVYNEFFRNVLAMDPIEGEKTDDERFPGALATFTNESMMQDGKALQAATSHYLGQTFSKSANIQFQNTEGAMEHAYTTSWGLSTRSIGGLIMSHGDDDGLRLPPKAAPIQVVVIPMLKDDATAAVTMEACAALEKQLKAKGVRVHVDRKDMRFSDKIWGWIKKGVPVRVEIGGREAEAGQVTATRRDLGRDSKKTMSAEEFVGGLDTMLNDIQTSMLAASTKFHAERITTVKTAAEVVEFFSTDSNKGFVRMPSGLLKDETFLKTRKDYAVTPRCLPFADEGQFAIVAKSY